MTLTVFVLEVTDIDGDERLEGIYSTKKIAEQRAEFIQEWDVTIKDFRIFEEFVREGWDD